MNLDPTISRIAAGVVGILGDNYGHFGHFKAPVSEGVIVVIVGDGSVKPDWSARVDIIETVYDSFDYHVGAGWYDAYDAGVLTEENLDAAFALDAETDGFPDDGPDSEYSYRYSDAH